LENVNWTVDKFVALSQNERANGKSPSPNGKSPAVMMAAAKKTTPAKGKSAREAEARDEEGSNQGKDWKEKEVDCATENIGST
jgi:hypothetical protein